MGVGSREERGASGAADGAAGVGAVEPHALGRQAVEAGRVHVGVAVATEHVGPLRIGHDENDAGGFRHGEFLGVWRVRLSEQCDEPCLLEVAVGGEGFGNSSFAHDDEGDAVRQRPPFILPFSIEPQPRIEEQL